MHAETILDATKSYWCVLKTSKTIFCALFGKIEGSLHKYHILMLDMRTNSCKSLL